MKTFCIDFDGVIHAYSKGWQDGSIYDWPVHGAFESIQSLVLDGHSVVIFSTRNPRQIKKWMDEHCVIGEYSTIYGFTCEVIPWWKKFWNKQGVVGITRRKLPAMVYLDDRAVCFDGNWKAALEAMQGFKTYQEPKEQKEPETVKSPTKKPAPNYIGHTRNRIDNLR